ncbi:MAG: hypothetical protein ACOCQ4_03065 [bacterium]
MDILGEIIVGILAFIGAYLGTKRIKKHLIDNYIEDRVTKAQNVNDLVLIEARNIISSFEKTYTENKPISTEELSKIIEQCRELSKKSEDGGKEVTTVSYLLYQTVKDLKANYESENSFEILTKGDVVKLVDNSLRNIIFYCTNSAPIPFSTRLKKRSTIKKRFRMYLHDKKFYGLRYQPFGLSLDPNSEIVLRYSEILNQINSSIYSRNFFLFLQSNLPIIYQMIAKKVYMPLIIDREQSESVFFIDSYKMHLIKIKKIKSFGEETGDYIEFYYSNLSPMVHFAENMTTEAFKSNYTKDIFLDKKFQLDDNYKPQKKLNETIKLKVKLDIAQRNYRKNKWAIKWKLIKNKLTH